MIGHLRKWGASFWHMGHRKQAVIVVGVALVLSVVGALGINYYNENIKKTQIDAEQARIEKEVRERLESPIFRSKPEVKKLGE